MLDWLAGFALAIGLLWAVAVFHQLGHYVTGRQIVGIPRADMRIVSHLFPRYLALSGDSGWVSPYEFDRYRECYEQYDSGYKHLERFVAGGELIQALVIVPLSIVLALAGFEAVSAILLVDSIIVTLSYLLVDAYLTNRSGSLSGDFSALWHVSKRVAFFLLLAFLFIHFGAFYFVV
ncbi:hypothetical protein ACFQJ7_13700 [Halovenus rubra]|uniref:Uncharacterized protein n=2 Tax=Halovenus rubra TaxID=869890 RepID=A0ACC7DYU1_9EURY|nr:hypothetical protein [Halovenus rubra]